MISPYLIVKLNKHKHQFFLNLNALDRLKLTSSYVKDASGDNYLKCTCSKYHIYKTLIVY